MGCTMELTVEICDQAPWGIWVTQITDFFVPRNYRLFSLAGWHGRRDYPDASWLLAPLVAPRGLPADCHPATQARYDQSFAARRDATWLSAQEWAAIVARLRDPAFRSRDEAGREHAPNGLVDAAALAALLNAYAGMGKDARVICWFD